MQRTGEQLRLGAFFNPTGHHVASWHHPEAQADGGVNFAHYCEIARTAERAKMDMVFIADNMSVREAHPDALARSAQYIANFVPITLISALAAVTSRIGLVATASTSYNDPYHIVRKFASIDHISNGRVGWNHATSETVTDAYNFSRDEHYAHDVRYDRAGEFARVVTGLWDSWEDDAFIGDKQSGIFLDPSKMHALDHKGEWFSVRGPLNVPRPPQGWPVIVQAGGSEDMMQVAADFAEVIFCAPLNIEQARKFYAELKGRMAVLGRSTGSMKIMPGLSPIGGRTAAEADEKQRHLDNLTHPTFAKEILSFVLGGADLSRYSLDDPMPEIAPSKSSGQSIINHVMDIARRGSLTLRETAQVVAGRAEHSSSKALSPTSPTLWRRGFSPEPATGSTSCRPIFPALWMTLSRSSFQSCSVASFSV